MVLFVILKIGDSMKKILLILLLLIPFIFMDKVYAYYDNTSGIYNYKIKVVFDVDNETLKIHEEFLTNDKIIDSNLSKTFSAEVEGLETNITKFEKDGNNSWFRLEKNSEYFIDYRYKCNPSNCKYNYYPIIDGRNNTYNNDISIVITEENNEKLPKNKVTINNGFTFYKDEKSIKVYNDNQTGIDRNFLLVFLDEKEEGIIGDIDYVLDILFGCSLSIPIVVALIASTILGLLKYNNKKTLKNNNTLKEWREAKIKHLYSKQIIIYLSSVIVSSVICFTLFLIIRMILAPSIPPLPESIVLFFIAECFVTSLAYAFPLFIYLEYKEAKLTSDIAKGELRFCDHYDFECKKKGLKYIYKIDVHENINNEVKTYTSGYKKAKEEPRGPVFLLYINDKNYYVDYLKK